MKTATPETDAAKMEIRYATATGIYDQEDFGGPPPMPYDEVVDVKEARKLEAERDAMKSAIRALSKRDFGSRGWDAECESAALRLRAFISTP